MHLFGEAAVVVNCSICCRILDNRAENRFIEIHSPMVTDAQLDAEGFGPRLQHRDCLGMTRLRNEKGARLSPTGRCSF